MEGRTAVATRGEHYALRAGEKPARRKCYECGSTKTAWVPQEEWVAGHAVLRCRVCGTEAVLWPK